MAEQSDKGKEIEVERRGPLMTPLDEMESWLEGLFPTPWRRRRGWPAWPEMARAGASMPRVDVIDRDEDMLVRAEVPGVDKKDLEVDVADATVVIRGSTRREREEEEGDYYRREIASGAFSRTVALPSDTDPDKAKARFADGVLEITLPKRESARRKRVEVE